MEHNISQMTSILLDTHFEPLKILHRILQHVFRHSCDFLMNGKFQLLDRSWSVRVHSCIEVSPPPKKKSRTDRSGEHGGQETSPKRVITCWGNMRRTSSDALACELWYHPVGTAFVSCLPDALGVLDTGFCTTQRVLLVNARHSCWRC
jgi:hypothetical protein